MTGVNYATDPVAIRALVEPDRVHRDAYLSDELFALEQQRLFARAWLYVGHRSQVALAGDYITIDLAGNPVIMIHDQAGVVRVLINRCAHKGAMVLSDRTGHVDRVLRCPYHSWSYRLDGSLLALPEKQGYEGTRLRECASSRGLTTIATHDHRGFIFARIATEGPSFDDYFGPIVACLDGMVDRSPLGELQADSAPLRNVIQCNWKIYLENINDALHANVTHESAAVAAQLVWSRAPAGTPKPVAFEQLLPFTSDNAFFAKMGGRIMPNGHSILGTQNSLHSAYSGASDYEQAMEHAYGAARAQEILSWSPQNALLYPSIAIKAAPQTMRVIRPLAVDRTLVETWSFRAKGAPDSLLQRTQLYNRLVFSPMSIVAHDDIHVFETIQRALRTNANPWVSLHRESVATESSADVVGSTRDVSGLDEAMMRNQFRAWVAALTA